MNIQIHDIDTKKLLLTEHFLSIYFQIIPLLIPSTVIFTNGIHHFDLGILRITF